MINSVGLSTLEVSAIARDLTRRPDGPGWQVTLPGAPSAASTLVPTGDGWTVGIAGRHSRWYDADDRLVAELDVVRGGAPGLGGYLGFGDGALSITDVNGAMALVEEVYPGGTRVFWSPAPGLHVIFGVRASVDGALAMARGLHEVDRATLDAATSPAQDRGDGCQSLFC